MSTPSGKILADYPVISPALESPPPPRGAPGGSIAKRSSAPDLGGPHGSAGRMKNDGKNSALGPFVPTLSASGGTYSFTLSRGLVVERVPGEVIDSTHAVVLHEPTNIDSSFPITVGQQITLVVPVTAAGVVEAGTVTIEVEAENPATTHYVPYGGDDQEGTAGTYRYKLAVLTAAVPPATLPSFRRDMAGSHVSHFRDLPLLENTILTAAGGKARVFQKFEKTQNQYLFRHLADTTQAAVAATETEPAVEAVEAQINVSEAGDAITIRGNGQKETIRFLTGGTESAIVSWDDGLVTTGTSQEVHIPLPGTATGSLTYQIGAESVQPLISWTLGLVQEVGAVPIPIPKYTPGTGITITPTAGNEFEVAATGSTPSHPWKCTAGTDDFIAVAEGAIIRPIHHGLDNEDRVPIVYVPTYYTAGSVQVTAAAGYLYARLEYGAPASGVKNSWVELGSPGFGMGLFHRYGSTVSVVFSESAPVDFVPVDYALYWPIAQVSLTGLVAAVEKQIYQDHITHDLAHIGIASAPF